MTQQLKILQLLDKGMWTCTSLMYAMYIADPRTRLAELKKAGYNLESRWCQNPDHRHDGQMKEWKLQPQPTKFDYAKLRQLAREIKEATEKEKPQQEQRVKQTLKTLW
jgi:hypothetical protein